MRKLLQDWEINATGTQITLTPLSPLSNPAYISTYVRDQLLGVETARETTTDEYLDQEYVKVEQAIRECRIGSRHGDRIYTLHQIVLRSLPFLNGDEMTEVLDQLEDLPCGMNLDGYERLWMDLYRAVNAGDLGKIESYVMQILVEEDRLTPARGEFLVGIGMIAYAAAGDGRGAETLWQRFAPAGIREEENSFIYEFLIQFARLRSTQD